MAYNYSNQAL